MFPSKIYIDMQISIYVYIYAQVTIIMKEEIRTPPCRPRAIASSFSLRKERNKVQDEMSGFVCSFCNIMIHCFATQVATYKEGKHRRENNRRKERLVRQEETK